MFPIHRFHHRHSSVFSYFFKLRLFTNNLKSLSSRYVTMKSQPPNSKEDDDSMMKPPSVSISISGRTTSLKITHPIENGCYLTKVETPETHGLTCCIHRD
mmetsp:Transcript_2788/g.6039  ORF Transcript_2788/g.6039 Transcript_2788/m.6039 type:complete len:100 (+) Transcript_2788:132-431(+)